MLFRSDTMKRENKLVPYKVNVNKQTWYEYIVFNGGEGLMLKDPNGRYYHKRGREYTKIKKFDTWDGHSFNVLLGQSATKFKGDELGGGRWDLVNPSKPSINYATGDIVYSEDADGKITGASAHFNVYGGPYTEHRLSSMFARVGYDFDERYMLQIGRAHV